MVTVSLCMIVRNEEHVLARCLDSVKDAMDEIIIVDTGSEDRTKEIAGSYTEKIYDFVWADDFAAARNAAFSRAEMEYCMWVDADDIMSGDALEQLIRWKTETDGTADVVMMKYVAGVDEEGNETFCYYRERLLKRACGFRWKGRVHEAIEPTGTVEYQNICVEHRSRKKKYGDRNLRIYEKMKEEGEIFSTRDLFYYARELYYHRRYEEAVGCFLFFLKREDAFSENLVEACRYMAGALAELGKGKEALGFLYQGLSYRVPGGELCCDIGRYFMDCQMWEQAAFWYEAALHSRKKERAGGFVEEEAYGYVPAVQLCVCYSRMGEQKKAYECHKLSGQYKPYGKEYLKNEEYFRNME